MVNCSDCGNFDSEYYGSEDLDGLCKIKNYTKPKNFNIGSCGLFKPKDKLIKEKINIFYLSFPFIYSDTDSLILDVKDNKEKLIKAIKKTHIWKFNNKKVGKCQKIGELNRIGFRKEHTCKEFSKIDKNFIKPLWCNFCKMDNEEKVLYLIKKGINSYNMLSLELDFDKKALDIILFDLLCDFKIFESTPSNYYILE